jgi:hypothetical protein
MRRLGVGEGLTAGIASAIVACSAARLPAPAYVPQATEALEEVDFPPPPARVEYVPARPADDAVWIDGESTWQGRRWGWKAGRWVVPPANASYAPWTTARDELGQLYFAAGRWRGADGGEVPEPTQLAVARTRGAEGNGPEGEPSPTAPNVSPGAAPARPGAPGAEESGAPETPSGTTPTGTQRRSSASVVDSGPAPVDAAIPDASIPDVVTHDALPLD